MISRAELTPALAKVADEVISHGIDDEEVLRLRREVFRDGIISRDEAKLMFHLNEQSGAGNVWAWYDYFVEALSAYFVWQQQPAEYLSDDDAAFLAAAITHDRRIDDVTEFGLLINVLQRLRTAPEALITLALQAIEQTVLGGGTVLFGPRRRRAGVIDAEDADIVRAVIFAAGGDGSLTITRREAELMFELNDRTAEKDNAPEWRTLFVQAVGHHLMFPRGAPSVPDRAEAARRDRWLEERRGTGAFLNDMLAGLNARIFAANAAELAGAGRREKAEAAARAERAARLDAFARGAIDAAEAEWLLARIKSDGTLHDNERALLAYIKDTATRIHKSLTPLLAEAAA